MVKERNGEIDMDLHKLIDEAIQDAIDYNKELGGTMTPDQEYWFYTGYQFGVEKHHKEIVNKVCEWLISYTTYPYTDKGNISKKKLNEFKQAIEE